VFSTRTNKLEIDIGAVEEKQKEIAELRKKMVCLTPLSGYLPLPLLVKLVRCW
jgi:hypothetical protein